MADVFHLLSVPTILKMIHDYKLKEFLHRHKMADAGAEMHLMKKQNKLKSTNATAHK